MKYWLLSVLVFAGCAKRVSHCPPIDYESLYLSAKADSEQYLESVLDLSDENSKLQDKVRRFNKIYKDSAKQTVNLEGK